MNDTVRTYDDEVLAAAAAVRTAAHVCRAVQAKLVTAETLEKKDRSPVTVADYASQALIAAELEARFPQDALVAEETSDELGLPENASLRALVTQHVSEARGDAASAEQVLAWIDRGVADPRAETRFWTLDPIDGTKGFLRGQHYAIALALIEEGQVVVAALGCPHLEVEDEEEPGALLLAVRDQGVAQQPLWAPGKIEAVRVGFEKDPAKARFCEPVESAHTNQGESARIAESLGITAEPIRLDSQAKYAAVARGDAEIYLRMPKEGYEEKIWDHAAGALVVEEAGGKVTDLTGAPLDFTRGRTLKGNQGVVATNRRLHEAVLGAF